MLAGGAMPGEEVSDEDDPIDLEDWLPGKAQQRSRSTLSGRGLQMARLETDKHPLHGFFPGNTGRAHREPLAIEEGLGDAQYAQATLHGRGRAGSVTGGQRLNSKSRSKQRNSAHSDMAAQGGEAAMGDDDDELKPHRTYVLVAKTLTKSDTAGRVILPRVSVESNLSFLMGYRSYTLPVKDRAGRAWKFVIKSWANGTEHRRVYVLEQVSEYIKFNRLREGDAIGICADESGIVTIEANTAAVRATVVRPVYGALRVQPQLPPPEESKAAPLIFGTPGRCTRNPSCAKPSGHPGFCSGPRAPGTDPGGRPRRDDAPDRAGSPVSGGAPSSSGGSGRPSRRPGAGPRRWLDENCSSGGEDGSDNVTAARLLAPEELVPGMRVVKALTKQDLHTGQVLLPAEHVEASLPPDCVGSSLIRLHARDRHGRTWELLVHAWQAPASLGNHHPRMLLLEQVAGFLKDRGAKCGDHLVLHRPPDGPLSMEVERVCPSTPLHKGSPQHSPMYDVHADGHEVFLDGETACHRTAGCVKGLGHQGFCSNHKGYRRPLDEDSVGLRGAHCLSPGEYVDGWESPQAQQPDPRGDIIEPQRKAAAPKRRRPARRAPGSPRHHQCDSVPHLVAVTCGSMSGVYDLRLGSIAVLTALHDKAGAEHLAPAAFMAQAGALVPGANWLEHLLVPSSARDTWKGAPVIPLGTWLGQRGLELDADGILMNDGTVPGLVSEFGALRVPGGGRSRHRVGGSSPLRRSAGGPPGCLPAATPTKRLRSSLRASLSAVQADDRCTTEEDSLAAEALVSLCADSSGTAGAPCAERGAEAASTLAGALVAAPMGGSARPQARSQKDRHALRKRSEVPLQKSNLGPFASALSREHRPALPNMLAPRHARYNSKGLTRAPLAVYRAQWQDTSLAMLGPAAVQQVAAAAEEAAQQAEAAADSAAARVLLEQPAGSILRRHLSTDPDASSNSFSRAGSCQLSEDESPAPIIASAPKAIEAQETLLELSKALRQPGLGDLKPQSSGNLASKVQLIDCSLARPDVDHAAQCALLPSAGEEQQKLSAGNDAAHVQTSAYPPENASVPGHTGTGGPPLALFKPTPQRQGQQSSQAALTRLQMFIKPIGTQDTEGLLPRGPAAAEMTQSANSLPRLTSPFANAPAVGPLCPRHVLHAHPATSALEGKEPAWHPGQADEESKRIRAYRGPDSAHQAGAEHVPGSWTVASGEDGWSAVPCLPTKSAFLKTSEVQHMWQQYGKDSATARHPPHEGGHINNMPQTGREGRRFWEPGSPAPAAFQPWGSHCVKTPVHAGNAGKEQCAFAAAPDHQNPSIAIGQPVAGSGILNGQQTPQLQPSAPKSGALTRTACNIRQHAGMGALAATVPNHQNNFADPSSPRVLSPPARGCGPQSPIETVHKVSPQSPTAMV
ncbi:probable regulatory protein viviparous-1 at N-terminal half [Coccomyxa sp. Obi]|nr:probable regulatory protein viviparous-1 at N-terminal half [Coccomyxa sp. Obi]